jgi:hypothetical protein
MISDQFQDSLAWQLYQRQLDASAPHGPSKRSQLIPLWQLAQKEFGTPYKFSRAYKGHFGCVNALAYSSGEGRLLATGGDDCRVLVQSSFVA